MSTLNVSILFEMGVNDIGEGKLEFEKVIWAALFTILFALAGRAHIPCFY